MVHGHFCQCCTPSPNAATARDFPAPPPIYLSVKRREIENLVAIKLKKLLVKNLLEIHLIHPADDLKTIDVGTFMTDGLSRMNNWNFKVNLFCCKNFWTNEKFAICMNRLQIDRQNHHYYCPVSLTYCSRQA